MWGWVAQLIGGAVGGVLLNIAGSLVGRVLTAIGIGAVSYVGVSSSLTYLKSNMITAFQALPPNVLGLLSLMQVGSCVSMVFSAMVMRMTLQGLSSDTMKGWVKK